MGKNKVVLDEELIVKEYKETSIGVEAMALKCHVGKKRIRDILDKCGVTIKHPGSQPPKEVRYKYVVDSSRYDDTDTTYWVLEDEKTGFTTKDVYNKAGVVTGYINKKYGIETPTLYARKKYYEDNGKYWWEQWLSYKEIKKRHVKKCPYCGWETVDVDNKSGAFKVHIEKEHNVSVAEYLQSYPEDRDYFSTAVSTKNLQYETDESKFVVCKVCGKKVSRLDWKHLSTHGLTLKEYKSKYHVTRTYSSSMYDKLKECSLKRNITISKNPDRFASNGEREIRDFIQNQLHIPCRKDRSILKGKEIDVYIPSRNLGIEYNGLKWHSEWFGGKNKFYHRDKLERCRSSQISLIQVFEDEYLLHKDIVLEKIKHLLNISDGKKKIYGRQCVVYKISKEENDNFLKQYHIQGPAKANVRFGAFFNGKLIAVMSFLFNSKIWELNRFATDYHYICPGVGGKLFNTFVKEFKPSAVKSFADRRWTIDYNNNLYVKLGFKLDSFTNPDYTYYNGRTERYARFHKFGFRKQILHKKYGLPLSMTETEMVKELGYDRIWNCGLIKYVWHKN